MKKITRLFEYMDTQARDYPIEKSFGRKEGDDWLFYSSKSIVEKAEKLAAGLMDLGLTKGDKVSIVSYKNRPEWYIVDLATQYLGIINVPLYPTISAGEYEYILNDAGVKACFVGDGDLWDKVHMAKTAVPTLQHVYTLDTHPSRPHYESLMTDDGREKVREISQYVDTHDLGLKKKLFFWALGLTDSYEHDKKYSGLAGLKKSIADKLIFSKWRDALGGSLEGIVTGAAPCPDKILRVFSYAGIPVMEGYGLTETSPTISINRFDGWAKVGSVGTVIDGVDILIDKGEGDYKEGEGEILVKGPNIMRGYYNKEEQTAAVFREVDGERYFCTGDIGKLVSGPDRKQYLKITDRKKELLKTSGGKYVAPAPIESKLKEDFLIEQTMVVGDKQKFVSALIVPAEDSLREWCRQHEVDTSLPLPELLQQPAVIEKYQQCVDLVNPDFSHVEQVKKFKLLPCTWEAVRADGTDTELTPTMKLKRRVIREKHASDISDIYS